MRARRIGVAALLVVATLLWTAAAFAVWANRQALDTDNWVDTSSELLGNEPVRNALGLFIVDELLKSADVQAGLEERLPPQLDRLAGPAAAALKEVARRNAPRLLGTSLPLQAWREAKQVAHSELLDIVGGKLENKAVALDLKTLFEQVAVGEGLPPGVSDRLPPEVATLRSRSRTSSGPRRTCSTSSRLSCGS
jgi:hypothetical protein